MSCVGILLSLREGSFESFCVRCEKGRGKEGKDAVAAISWAKLFLDWRGRAGGKEPIYALD
jgi:hypothetical protein